MLRWLLVGMLLMGVGIGFQRQWIWVDRDKMSTDLSLPIRRDPQPLKQVRSFLGIR